MMNAILKHLSCPCVVLSGIVAISVLSLTAALDSEVFLGLEPCILCIYQRWPYAIVTVLGIIGLSFRKRPHLPQITIAASGLAFLINSAIAFYHTGVEQHWWKSAVEGCVVPNFGDEPQSILENIMSAPSARCDEIPWQDPIIGLSMANYNVLLCFGLFAVCALSAYLLRHTQHSQTGHKA